MKRIILIFFSILFLSAFSSFAQMTDEAVLSYIKSGISRGKSKSQLATELISKGVTEFQIKRLMSQYNVDSDDMIPTTETRTLGGRTRRFGNRVVDASYKEMIRDSIRNREFSEKTGKKPYSGLTDEDMLKDVDEEVLESNGLKAAKKEKKIIYGHDIFNSERLSFEPNENSATPKNYILGPGDELLIEVWGVNEASYSCIVTPEGRISITQVGPIQVSGLTLDEATAKIKKLLSRKYSLAGDSAPSKISVTIGNVRTIKVNVLGEVRTPGTYRLSSLSNVFNALYCAGGVTPIGSLRSVQVVRGGKVVSEADIYKFIFEGAVEGNESLSDGDAVIVPPYNALVNVKGGVKRPMYYEIVPGEPVENILKYCGGFSSKAYTDEVCVERVDADNSQAYTVRKDSYASFGLQDGDILSAYVNAQKDKYVNRVEVKGAVCRPGIYAIGGDIASVRQLVEHAGGLLDDAFVARAQILREKPDRSMEIVAVPLGALMSGSSDDVLLRKNDILVVSNVNDIEKKGDVVISGYIVNPGAYEYAESMTVEDLILLAGGLESGASEARVDVSRRIINPDSTHPSDTLAQVFTCKLNKGLVVEGEGFKLQPFDVVAVRKSPSFVAQRNVKVTGSVVFPGEYTLLTNKDRLSDIFKRCGGETSIGYVGGAVLMRKMDEEERMTRRNLATSILHGSLGKARADTSFIKKVKTSEVYPVGINLVKALAKPGSSADVLLQDGDELVVPSVAGTVRVQGEVLYPNAVTYIPGKSLRYYVEQAGGFSNEAKKRKAYVLHMNGTVSVGLNSKLDPGAEVVIPAKPERAKTTVGEWLGLGTAAASITTMIATIVNIMN